MTSTNNNTRSEAELIYANAQLTLALQDTVATLMALAAKYQDGMGNLVATSVYNARRQVAEQGLNR